MSGRSAQLRIVDPVLTQLLRGYVNAEFVGHNLFPIVSVDKEAGKIPTFGKESFLVFNTERALRAKSNKLPVEARTTVDFATVEHDAVYPTDYREISEDMLDLEKYAAFRAQAAVQLRMEKQIADLALNDSLYPSGSKITLSGSGQFTHGSSTPIATFRNATEAVRGKIAKRPNVLVIGAATFNVLQDHPTLQDRIKYSQLGVLTVDLLKAILNIPNIFIGDAVYATDAGVVTDIWGDNCVMAYVPGMPGSDTGSIYEPSFGYTLRKRGFPEVDKYEEEGGKLLNVRSTDNFVPKLVGADAGYVIKDTNA